jgi:hypothetical protein
VVQNEAKKTVKQGQIDLLVHFGQDGLHQNVALPFAGFPDVGQIVNSLAPLNNFLVKKRRKWSMGVLYKPEEGVARYPKASLE